MAPSAVEAGKGKGKVRCVMSLRRVCGLWLHIIRRLGVVVNNVHVSLSSIPFAYL
jgi:hypothetical protein